MLNRASLTTIAMALLTTGVGPPMAKTVLEGEIN
jgi:hypothetical protein